MTHTEIPAIYEAGFTFQGIRTRVDILKRSGHDAFDLVEVKSTTKVKPEHISDVAIQVYVAEGSGVAINQAFLMHLNRSYTPRAGKHDLERRFTLQDVTANVRSFVAGKVPGELARMWEVLQQWDAPDIETGLHCNNPYRCSFYGHCHQTPGRNADGEV